MHAIYRIWDTLFPSVSHFLTAGDGLRWIWSAMKGPKLERERFRESKTRAGSQFLRSPIAICSASRTPDPHLHAIYRISDGSCGFLSAICRISDVLLVQNASKTRARAVVSVQNTSESTTSEAPDRYWQCFSHTRSPLARYLPHFRWVVWFLVRY